MLLTVAVAMSGNVQAGDQVMAANGQSQKFTSATELPGGNPSTNYKLIGGWDHSGYDSEDSLDHAGINTDITLTGGSYDEIVGGNHVRNTKSSQTSPVMRIGNTKVTISGGSLEYAVGGSKASTSGGTNLINGRVEMVVSGGANISKKLVGGNYVKNSSAQGAGATPDEGGESVVGDIVLTLQGGTFEDMVIGGSFAENYTPTSEEDFAMKLTTLKAEKRALNSSRQSGHSLKSPEKSGQNFTLLMGAYAIIYTPIRRCEKWTRRRNGRSKSAVSQSLTRKPEPSTSKSANINTIRSRSTTV